MASFGESIVDVLDSIFLIILSLIALVLTIVMFRQMSVYLNLTQPRNDKIMLNLLCGFWIFSCILLCVAMIYGFVH